MTGKKKKTFKKFQQTTIPPQHGIFQGNATTTIRIFFCLHLYHAMCSSLFLSHNQCLLACAMASEYFDGQRIATDQPKLQLREALHALFALWPRSSRYIQTYQEIINLYIRFFERFWNSCLQFIDIFCSPWPALVFFFFRSDDLLIPAVDLYNQEKASRISSLYSQFQI